MKKDDKLYEECVQAIKDMWVDYPKESVCNKCGIKATPANCTYKKNNDGTIESHTCWECLGFR